MKCFPLLFVLLLPVINGQSLQDDLNDLQQQVPMPQIQELFVRYLMADPQFRETIQFLRSAEFSELWNQFLEVPKVRELFTYMTSAGLMVNEALQLFAEFTGMEKPRTVFKRSIGGGFGAYINEVVELCSNSALAEVHEEKKASSSMYREMISKIDSTKFRKLLADAFADSEVRRLQDQLSPYGIDFNSLLKLWKSFFGWSSIF